MKSWNIPETTESVKILASRTGLSEIIAQLLVNRNLTNEECSRRFLHTKRSNIYPPSLLPDLENSVLRIKEAIKNKERILLFSDYDADGVTSLAILSDYLSKRKADFEVMIPSRLTQGYGFNSQALSFARQKGISLIIALDCGTNSDLLNKAVDTGINVVVIDHHEVFPKERKFLLVNPKREGSGYPFRELSTGFLVFKLIWAFKNIFPYEYLDLATISVVCDVAPLVDENRALVSEGLKKMRNDPHLGIKHLMQITRIKKENLGAFHLGWILGPRINAIGRIGCAYPAWELLSTECDDKAAELAGVLDFTNRLRRSEVQKVLNTALKKIEDIDLKKELVIVLSEDDWHVGVLGIVASRIKEKFSRPAFLISLNSGIGRGSGRSIDNFHLIKALQSCKESLLGYGGHEKACGLEIEQDNIERFKDSLNAYAGKNLALSDLVPQLSIDKEITFEDITAGLLDSLELFTPFGEANPEPLFLTRNLKIKNVTQNKWGTRLVWFESVRNKKSLVYPARVKSDDKILSFKAYADSFDIVYRLRSNKNSSFSPAILKIEDIRTS